MVEDDMISKFIIIAWTLLIAWAFFAGATSVVDSGVDPESGAFAFAMFVSIIFHFFAWMIVATPTYMISRMFAKRREVAVGYTATPPPRYASTDERIQQQAEIRRPARHRTQDAEGGFAGRAVAVLVTIALGLIAAGLLLSNYGGAGRVEQPTTAAKTDNWAAISTAARTKILPKPDMPHVTVPSRSDQPLSTQLHVLTFSCSKEHGYAHVRGEVRNLSSRPIEGLMAVGEFRQADGTLVKTAESMVDYNPLLPGQTSPFHALTSDNPAATKCHLAFKTFWGSRITYTYDRKSK
jgi:hypothetical protein